MLTVRQAIDTTLKEITKAEISKSLSPSVLKDLIGRIVDAYVKSGSGAGMEVLLNEKDLKETTKLVMGSMKEKMKSGIEIKTDNKITGGFKVSLKDENVEHDFTDEAITESLCSLLRPHIAEIVKGQEKKQD